MAPRKTLGALILLATVATLLLASLPGAMAAPVSQQTNVNMADNTFQPASIQVQVGTTVVWTNTGSLPHTSTSEGAGAWDSGIKTAGQNYSHTFNTPGTFPYFCTVHRATGMVGTVTVQAAAQPTATAAPPTATPAPPTATATRPPATATATQAAPAVQPTATSTPAAAPPPPTPTASAAPLPPPLATPTPVPPPAKPAATPTPTPAPPPALPRTGDTGLPPWTLVLAGFAIVLGLAVRTAARG